MITPSLATGILLVIALAGREALRVSAARDRWLRTATAAAVALTLVWFAFAAQRLLALQAGAV